LVLVAARQSHEVVTDCLLVSVGFSFHNCITKHHHVPIFGIFLLVWLAAMCAEQEENFCIEPNSSVQDGMVAGGVDGMVACDSGQCSNLVERPGYNTGS
jgi:hypothetical protein